MEIHIVKVPDIGEGIAEVEVVEWQVQLGDTVVADQVIAEVMTDKATVEVPSPMAGRVIALGGRAGEKLAVGGESWSGSKSDGVGRRDAVKIAGSRRRWPRRTRVSPLPRAAATGKPLAPAAAPGGKPLASPSVRATHANWKSIWTACRGSGPDGRIMHDDLVRHAARRNRETGRVRALRRAQRRGSGTRDRVAPADRAAHAGRRCASRTSPMSRKSTSPNSKRCARGSTTSVARPAGGSRCCRS